MKSIIKTIFITLGLGFLFSFLFRLVFVFYFKPTEVDWTFVQLMAVFLHGLRFDLSALVFLNIIFIWCLYFEFFRKSKIFIHLWSAVNVFFVFVWASDFVYYSLYASKLDWSFFASFNGLSLKLFYKMSLQFLLTLPVFLLIFFSYKSIIDRTLNNNLKKDSSDNSLLGLKTSTLDLPLKKFPIYFFGVLAIGFLSYRGGLQKRVLSPQHTWIYASGDSFLASATSNPIHYLLRSKRSSNIPSYYKNTEKHFLPAWTDTNQYNLNSHKRPKNVLFIFVESLSSYAVENHQMPKLETWSALNKNDVYFTTDFYANGNLSKDALVSVFFGLPSYFNIHYFESKYAKNNLKGLGQIAKSKGYETFFLHSAPAGTQFFDVISKAAGFENYISLIDNFKGAEELKGTWGVHDEVLYSEAQKYISNLKKPFLGTLFSTSTHVPFFGTPNNPDDTGSAEQNYFLALNYADQALIDFFKNISKESWFKDTLFVVTGDHSPPLSADWNRRLEELSRVPCLLYWPESNLGLNQFKSIGRHADLPKTVFSILDLKPKHWTPYGESLFKVDTKNSDQIFFTGSNSAHLVLAPKKIKTLSVYEDPLKLEVALEKEKVQRMVFELKDYVYRLEKNLFYFDSESK